MADFGNLKEDAVYAFTDVQHSFKAKGRPKSIEPGEHFSMEIEMFRSGKFKHPWYGDLDFTDQYLNDIVRNFNNGVRTRHIACNIEHEPEKGAIGWIDLEQETPVYVASKTVKNELGQEETRSVLMGWVAFNSYGYSLLVDNRFRFWSAEVFPRWKSREVNKMSSSADGTDIEVQAQTSTPVLSGGAMTNDPFINGLSEIALSNKIVAPDGKKIIYSSDAESDGYMVFSYHNDSEPINPTANDEDMQPESFKDPAPFFVDELKDVQTKVDVKKTETVKSTKGVNMNFSELFTKMSGMSVADKIAYLESVSQNFSDGDSALVYGEMLSSLRDQQTQSSVAQAAEQRRAAAVKSVEDLQKRNVELGLKIVEAKQQSYSDSVKIFEQAQLAAGVIPAVVNAAVEMLNSLTPDSKEQKFSVMGATGDSSSLSHIEMFTQVFSVLPSAYKTVDLKTELSAGGTVEARVDNTPEADPVIPEPSNSIPAKILKFSNSEDGKFMPWIVNTPEDWDQIAEDGTLDLAKTLGM